MIHYANLYSNHIHPLPFKVGFNLGTKQKYNKNNHHTTTNPNHNHHTTTKPKRQPAHQNILKLTTAQLTPIQQQLYHSTHGRVPPGWGRPAAKPSFNTSLIFILMPKSKP
jgi:hypothetical protein